MRELRRIPIHRALTRPLLLAGAERPLVILNTTLIAMLLFGLGFGLLALTLAGMLASVGFWGLRMLASSDPQFSEVFARHQRYQSFYSAGSSPLAKAAIIKPSISYKGLQ